MPVYLPEPEYRHGTAPRTAVLLINLGTPEAPTAPALRRYLKEFLSDPRVVEIPRLVWWPILNGIILNTRPKKSAEKYAAVWTKEGSPLRVHTAAQAKLLQGYLGHAGHAVIVDYAMRYGKPSVADALTRLKQQNCTRILLLPLYPQYAGSTTATALDAAFAHLQQVRNQPEIRTVRNFHEHPGYIAALAASVRQHWNQAGLPGKSYRLFMSFHGVPRRTLDLGDPYHCECRKTGRLLAEALNLAPEQVELCFQSRFGKAEWLQPYTAPTLERLGREGVERVDVICPGFVADCLETLEEIALEGKASFLGSGGKEFHYIPCLNQRPEWLSALADIALQHLQGWPLAMPEAVALEQSAQRARTLGAKN